MPHHKMEEKVGTLIEVIHL